MYEKFQVNNFGIRIAIRNIFNAENFPMYGIIIQYEFTRVVHLVWLVFFSETLTSSVPG